MSKYELINIKLMKRALLLASLGKGLTSPNPMVGAVITDELGNIISEGFHHKAGSPHAEAMAFNNLKMDPKGGSLYVNLEPCCHHGKTPPCVDKVIKSGVKKVYIAMKDPDLRVSGRSIKLLNNAGIKVFLGLCKKEALNLNKSFIHKNLTGQSYGVLKWAMSIDGRIGLKNGESKWISNELSRASVHAIRADFDAIIIGGNTLRKDNPLLTTRGKKDIEPMRVVFTKSLNLPEKCNLWECDHARTLVLYDQTSANESYLKQIPPKVEIVKLKSDNPKNVAKVLAERGCNKILWECGPSLATSAIKNKCIQETITYISPKILGGINSKNPFGDFNFNSMNEIINLKKIDINLYGDDVYLENYL